MMEQKWKSEASSDVVNLVPVAWLVLTPWIFAFALDAAAG